MGFLATSSTVYAQAYLTEVGRKYLFNSTNTPRYITLPNGVTVDRLKIERFSLGDSDMNYNIPILLGGGDIPDVSGENSTTVTGAKGRQLTNLISPGASNIPSVDISSLQYIPTHENVTFNLNQAANLLHMVTTQQLATYIDGVLVNDGVYTVTPTSYGPNSLQNNELIITLKEPTQTEPGYRMRIIFPSTGSNYNKFTIQFEKASTQTGVVVPNVITTIQNTPGNA